MAHDAVDDAAEIRQDIFREKPQNEVALALQELVLAAVAAIGVLVVEVSRSVDLHGELGRTRTECTSARHDALSKSIAANRTVSSANSG